MTLIIGIAIGGVAGFIAGILVGRRNQNKVETAVKYAETIEKKVTGK